MPCFGPVARLFRDRKFFLTMKPATVFRYSRLALGPAIKEASAREISLRTSGGSQRPSETLPSG